MKLERFSACGLPVLTVLVLFAGGSAAARADSAEHELRFEKDIRPILKVACFHCHGEGGTMKGGLDVRLVRLMRAGGDSGPVLIPGSPEESLLWRQLLADEMPKGEKKLSRTDKEVIRTWIAQGARTARPEPADVAEARFTLEERSHWAFQPVERVGVPALLESGSDSRPATPVDAFLTRRLTEAGLTYSPPAGRRTLIRRLHFDLTGLPPTPKEVEAFVADPSPSAWERRVDRLLASPQFGVRWGRHWLDAAGFAESDGSAGTGDVRRPHAWRYRDYVIDAMNAGKPLDAFLREQLAGDELVRGDLDVRDGRQRELLTATGFLRMAPDPSRGSDTLTDRNAAVANTVEVVSSAILGLTVGCAQCHDHKYDPIGIDDYYRFRAIFDPAFPLSNWQPADQRLIDLTEPEVRTEAERVEAEARALEEDLEARIRARALEIQEEKLAHVPDEVRENTREAVKTEPGDRTRHQRELLDLYPMVKPIPNIIGLLVEYDGAAFRAFEKEREPIAALRERKPPLRMIMATTEPKGDLPVSRIFFRGDPESPRDAVDPGELSVLERLGRVPVRDPEQSTSGRRLAYARQLTDGTHPLTARVFVNRLWAHHLGRGLVATPGDFGLAGEAPSHPALLDWLAGELVRRDWHPKPLHRLILLSSAWGQDSRRRPPLESVDPENAWFARANVRRLEAEALRDALLAVTGTLNATLGGPSVRVTENAEGKAVLEPAGEGDSFRRSAFVEVQRGLPYDLLSTFDQPVMLPNCHERRHTTVATQALWFLNDEAILAHAATLARALGHSAGSGQRLDELFLRLFGERPTSREREVCETFLAEQEAGWKAASKTEGGIDDPSMAALASLCQVLLASNRFLYVD